MVHQRRLRRAGAKSDVQGKLYWIHYRVAKSADVVGKPSASAAMPLAVDEFETDDEWSFISPKAKPHEKSDTMDSSTAYAPYPKITDTKRKQVYNGSQRQSVKRYGAQKNNTYAHRLPPNARSGDSDSHGYGSSGDDHASAASSLREQQDWWEVGAQMKSPRVPLTSGSSSYSSLGTSTQSNGHAGPFLPKHKLGRTRAHVQEALHVSEGGRMFLDTADGYDGVSQTTDDELDDALEAWLAEDISHGFIRVYSPPGHEETQGGNEATLLSRLIPCTTAAEAHEICHVAGLQPSSLHVQLNGDIVRRLDAYERPLAMQNDYLARIGYSDPNRIQKEGLSTELGYLIRFYSGKSFDDSTYARRQLSAVIDVKTGGILQRWSKRLCAISGTKLTIHKGADRMKDSEMTTLQLAKGTVEEVKIKGRGFCIKLSTSCTPQKTVFLSFETQNVFNKWLKKARKATAKLPSSADLSGCNLEFLPETVFTNDQLTVLNLRHNALRPMPTEENIYTIGWLDDISRFKYLRSLNLADNGLDFFPPSICDLVSLVELNLATNRIAVVPATISQLTSLQALHLHNNHLSTLPPEVTLLKKLAVLVLAFNKFRSIPASVAMLTDVRVSECDTLVMAGNFIDAIPSEVIAKLKHVKRIDLRMNNLVLSLSETVRFNQMEHLTHLDIRDNRAVDLDLRYVKMLEYINCERNGAKVLQLHGGRLKTVIAAKNEIQQIVINPKPEWLETMDFSRNRLEKLPDWIPECFFLTKLNVCYNRLASLPQKMFSESPKLKLLQADHNRLKSLPSEMGSCILEEVHLHANQLQELPQTFLSKTNKLRLLNLSGNQLTALPPASDIPDLNKLHELYLTSNNLGDDCLSVIARYGRLKVLHIAHNALRVLRDEFVSALDLLQELNVSANHIDILPPSLEKLEHLTILRAHSNKISRLPRLDAYKSIAVLDMSCNPLQNVSAADLLSIGNVHALDISSGDALNGNSVDTNCRSCLKRSKEMLYDEQPHPSDCELTHVCEVGIAESHGSRNNTRCTMRGLCVAALNEMQLYDRNEALFGVVDGGKNDEIVKSLRNSLPHILNEELIIQEENHGQLEDKDEYNDLEYLKYSFLSAHKKLRHSAQRLGASVLLCHLLRYGGNDAGRYRINVANVGDVRAIVSRRGEIVQLSRNHVVPDDREECRRVSQNDGIITEEGKVNGISHLSRCIGNSYLYPQVVPLPSLSSERLRMTNDEFLIIANGAFWRHVTYGEAIQMAARAPIAASAAKSLQDLAQAYGCADNLGIVVVRFGPQATKCLPPQADATPAEPRSESDSGAGVRTSRSLEPQPQTEDNYVNLESLRMSGHIPSPWDNKLSRRPMPTPRTSLVKVFSSAASVNDDGDNCARLSRVASKSHGGRPSAAPPPPPPMWSASMVRDWQFRSDGFLLNAAPASSSSSSSSSSPSRSASSSSTLTGSGNQPSDDEVIDGGGGDDGSACSRLQTPTEAGGPAEGRRSSRPSRSGRAVGSSPASRLRRRRRLCSSDTRLQYPSAIELKGSENYFNRPALIASSEESFLPDDDWQEESDTTDGDSLTDQRQEELCSDSATYDRPFDGGGRLASAAVGHRERGDGSNGRRQQGFGEAPATAVAAAAAAAAERSYRYSSSASGSDAPPAQSGAQATVGPIRASLAGSRGGSNSGFPPMDSLRRITAAAAAAAARPGTASSPGPPNAGQLAAGVYRAWPRPVMAAPASDDDGLLSEEDVRALQTYSDASLLSYKDQPVQLPQPERGGGGASGDAFYFGTDRSQHGQHSVVSTGGRADSQAPPAPARMPAAPRMPATPQLRQPLATTLGPAIISADRFALSGAAASAGSSGRDRPAAADGCEAETGSRSRSHARAASADAMSRRLHPGVHQIEFYHAQADGESGCASAPSVGKDKVGSYESSSAYGSLTWSSSTMGHYDTYL